jgi:hypothetical protein
MFGLISAVLVIGITSPKQEDYVWAHWLISPGCSLTSQEGLDRKYYDFTGPFGEEYVVYKESVQSIRVAKALNEICINLELIDSKDYKSIATNIEDMRERAVLYPKYPNPNTYNFHISKEQVSANRKFALLFKTHILNRIDSKLEIDRTEILERARDVAHSYYLFWNDFEDVFGKNSSFSFRKTALIRVCDTMGMNNFYHGIYPDAAPYHLFNEHK